MSGSATERANVPVGEREWRTAVNAHLCFASPAIQALRIRLAPMVGCVVTHVGERFLHEWTQRAIRATGDETDPGILEAPPFVEGAATFQYDADDFGVEAMEPTNAGSSADAGPLAAVELSPTVPYVPQEGKVAALPKAMLTKGTKEKT